MFPGMKGCGKSAAEERIDRFRRQPKCCSSFSGKFHRIGESHHGKKQAQSFGSSGDTQAHCSSSGKDQILFRGSSQDESRTRIPANSPEPFYRLHGFKQHYHRSAFRLQQGPRHQRREPLPGAGKVKLNLSNDLAYGVPAFPQPGSHRVRLYPRPQVRDRPVQIHPQALQNPVPVVRGSGVPHLQSTSVQPGVPRRCIRSTAELPLLPLYDQGESESGS